VADRVYAGDNVVISFAAAHFRVGIVCFGYSGGDLHLLAARGRAAVHVVTLHSHGRLLDRGFPAKVHTMVASSLDPRSQPVCAYADYEGCGHNYCDFLPHSRPPRYRNSPTQDVDFQPLARQGISNKLGKAQAALRIT